MKNTDYRKNKSLYPTHPIRGKLLGDEGANGVVEKLTVSSQI